MTESPIIPGSYESCTLTTTIRFGLDHYLYMIFINGNHIASRHIYCRQANSHTNHNGT